MSSFISVTFGSFKNSFQKYSLSSFFKEAFDVVFSLILEGSLILISPIPNGSVIPLHSYLFVNFLGGGGGVGDLGFGYLFSSVLHLLPLNCILYRN